MKIAVIGTGYVGLSLAVLLSTEHEVIACDLSKEKVDLINKRISPIHDEYVEKFFAQKTLNLLATTNLASAVEGASFVIISTPTNYDENKNTFDTTSVEESAEKVLSINKDATIVIKSTIPIGFTKKLSKRLKTKNILFSPEFLRESKALYDNLNPSRIIVGLSNFDKNLDRQAHIFAFTLARCAGKDDIPILFMSSTEAEAVKLFSNTYLAMRIAYFNEIDTYAEINGLNTKAIVEGVCLDPRIGNYYNNPSFGYGGYCLPKDTKQLKANYKNIPENIITAVVKANDTRKTFVTNQILKKLKEIRNATGSDAAIGIYRLTMKTGADNFRESAIQAIIKKLVAKGEKVIIYEPNCKQNEFLDCKVYKSLEKFKKDCCYIVANRINEELEDIKEKVYTRDLFGRD